ncbi:MAG: hypothetical protein IKR52_03965 [Paludibacteraceae bacterium]|nr:hypothetical protein [Paludibacteraceae bacterium]
MDKFLIFNRRLIVFVMMVCAFMGAAYAQKVENGERRVENGERESERKDSSVVVLKVSQDTQYLLVYHSDAYIDSLIRDCGADETELDNLYIALDDYGYYLSECAEVMESKGLYYRSVDNETEVYVEAPEGRSLLPIRSFFGIVVVAPDGKIEYADLLGFLDKMKEI